MQSSSIFTRDGLDNGMHGISKQGRSMRHGADSAFPNHKLQGFRMPAQPSQAQPKG